MRHGPIGSNAGIEAVCHPATKPNQVSKSRECILNHYVALHFTDMCALFNLIHSMDK